jgi:hypothetical protein
MYNYIQNEYKLSDKHGRSGRDPILVADNGSGKKILKALEFNRRLIF